MARDIKWALREAEEKNEISKISVDEDVKKKLLNSSRSASIKMFIASLIVLAIAVAIVVALVLFVNVIIYSFKMILLYLVVLVFPIFSIYNIFATFRSVSKGDYDFYSGEVLTKTDKGYKIKGLEDLDLGYLSVAKPKEEPKAGDKVKLFRCNDELNMFDL